MTPSAFWIPVSASVFQATIHTQGPWNPQFQHGGPPAALLVRQMEQCTPRPEMVLARSRWPPCALRLASSDLAARSNCWKRCLKMRAVRYEDGSGNHYLPMFRQPVLVFLRHA